MDFSLEYNSKCMSASSIAEKINDDQNIWHDIMLSAPVSILNAIGKRGNSNELTGISINSGIELYHNAWYDANISENIKGISIFASDISRNAINKGYGDFLIAGDYSEIPNTIKNFLDVDVFVASVSKMDEDGYFSMGTVGSISQACIEKATYIYVEVNEYVPYIINGPKIHISEVNGICERNAELIQSPDILMDPISETIGNLIAEEIPNGATIQLGIGGIPNAVGMALKNKKNLGIHTEMLTDSMIELLKCGAVDNSHKSINKGKTVATFAFGKKSMYDYLNNNCKVEILPVSYVNNPYVIARNKNMISVNAAVQVDFFGQVCAESIGEYILSGSGGQADFVRGANMSEGGKSFIAFPSTAKGGTESRILSNLTEGSAVTTGKNDVSNIVTEYGIARLRGKTLSQRAKSLISIAHPDFRDKLKFEAKRRNLIV